MMAVVQELATERACPDCPYATAMPIASRGATPAPLLFLSGAPRVHEEREGVAFASPLFPWLEDLLATVGLDPIAVHYATITGCRPPYQRPLRSSEVSACAPRLERTIAAVAPEIIVLCGQEIVSAMLGDVMLTRGHGQLVVRGRRRYYPIRHPYSARHYDGYVDEVTADLRYLAALLADPHLAQRQEAIEMASVQESQAAPAVPLSVVVVEPTAAEALRPFSIATPISEVREPVAATPTVEAPQTVRDDEVMVTAEEAIDASMDDSTAIDLDERSASPAFDEPEAPAQLSLF